MTTGHYHHNNKVLIKHLLWWQHTLLDDSCKIPSKLDKFPPFFAVKFLFVLSRERTISIPRTIKRPLYGGHWMEWGKLAAASHNSMRAPRSQNCPKQDQDSIIAQNKTKITELPKTTESSQNFPAKTSIQLQQSGKWAGRFFTLV